MNSQRSSLFILLITVVFPLMPAGPSTELRAGRAQKPDTPYKPVVPKAWDERALADLQIPLVDPSRSPRDISADNYYRIPVRPIYKTYPRYRPDREPRGYQEWLRQQEPVVLWDDRGHRPRLVTEGDWIAAGELVFDAPILFSPHTASPDQMRAFILKTGDLYDKDGVSPFTFYVVRERGRLETGEVACAECHTRVMPDGTTIKGAQGNRPIEQVTFFELADRAAKVESQGRFLAQVRQAEQSAFAAPWLRSDPYARLRRFSAAEIEAVHSAIPAGVFARQGTSPFSPAKVPDLIGIRERRYLDATGLVQHRSIGDLMRYAALNQGMDLRSRWILDQNFLGQMESVLDLALLLERIRFFQSCEDSLARQNNGPEAVVFCRRFLTNGRREPPTGFASQSECCYHPACAHWFLF